MARFSALLDANVLYGSYVRDLLLGLAHDGYFAPQWSREIQEETQRALARRFPHSEAHQKRKMELMNEAFPGALVGDFQHLVDGLEDTDTADRHVLAAAIRSNSSALVTFNLRHFPRDLFETHGIELVHPDAFLLDLADLNRPLFLSVVCRQLAAYSRPALTAIAYASVMQKAQCPGIAAVIAESEAEIESILDDIEIQQVALDRLRDSSPRIRVKIEDLP